MRTGLGKMVSGRLFCRERGSFVLLPKRSFSFLKYNRPAQELEEKAASPAELCCQAPCGGMKALAQGRAGDFRHHLSFHLRLPVAPGCPLGQGLRLLLAPLGLRLPLGGRACFILQTPFWIMEIGRILALCFLSPTLFVMEDLLGLCGFPLRGHFS